MRPGLFLLFTLWTVFTSAQSQYEKAWTALNANNWTEASRLLNLAQQEEANFKDAYISNLYLRSYHGKETEIKDFASSVYGKADNPYAYIYALWFNSSVTGSYGKKSSDHQLRLLNQLIDDNKSPGTLVAAANYQMGMHYLFSDDFPRSRKYYDKIGSIRNWQYTGPFENLSQSGYYKNQGPLDHPEQEAVFKSLTNADVKWFVPAVETTDGWTPVSYQFNETTAVVYAQNFVQSGSDQTVYLNVGASGSVKVWINDEQVIGESKERQTEMDAYTVKVNLKKGTNRVLVQLGYTGNTFANFIVRFTDQQGIPVSSVTGSSITAPYPKVPAAAHKKYQLEPQFAEAYFGNAIQRSPGNLVNYLLLADIYLRNKKVIEARNLMTTALKKAPDNCLLIFKMIEVLIKEGNRTLLLEEVEKIKQLDPESLTVLELKLKEEFENEKYEEGATVLEKRIKLYGEDESTAGYKLQLLVAEKKYDELVAEVEKLYEKYPGNEQFTNMMFNIKKEVYKDKKAAMKVYENYMKNRYNYSILMTYANLLEEQGDNNKSLAIKQKIANNFPYSPQELYSLAKYHFAAKQYDKAEEYASKILALSPYSETYWEQLGDIKSEKKKVPEALDAYNQSLKFNPNQYEIINKIRKLNGKPESYKLFNEPVIDDWIKKDKIEDAKNTDYGYYYILDQKDVICHPGGASEEYYTYLIRITNEKGVDRYKESSIGYGNSQTLLIEKAEVVKKNMTRIKGEVNDNEIVFANLEAGDVVVFKYRIRNYNYGRMSKEFWDKYFFGGQIYSAAIRYNLLMPANQEIFYKFDNSDVKPVISNVEDFKMYSWNTDKVEPDEDEPVMPALVDVVAVLHITTIPSWKEITDWYSDISYNKAEEDFEMIELYKELFPDNKKQLSQFQKARIIYDYIESNIRYSSVSFRQSNFVPQRPATTLTTRLGDCKDLSSLFVTLAQMAGIKAQLVLVDTRDNGQKDVLLPGIEFNHCIVKAVLDNKVHYIEMTDNYLPFNSLPNSLIGAAVLDIPYRNTQEKSELKLLQPDLRTKDVSRRIIEIKPVDTDLEVKVRTIKYGNESSKIRSAYLSLDNDKQMKELEKTIANGFKNNVKLASVNFTSLEKLEDSVVYDYAYRVKNEVAEIGSMKTFRIVYPDVVATLDNFSSDTRQFPIEYGFYEDVDIYETIVSVIAPAGMKFIELPSSEELSFRDMKFTIKYDLKAPGKLMVTRKFVNKRSRIPAADYAAFKSFFEKIVKAEQKFITYK